jgi:hypothetical protein
MSAAAIPSRAFPSMSLPSLRPAYRPIAVCLAAAFTIVLTAGGCGDSSGPGPAGNRASSGKGGGTAAARPSPEQVNAWLTTGLPSLAPDVSAAPIKLTDPQLAANEFGQEILTVNYERPVVVRTLAAEASLVLLPTLGGRVDVYVNPGTLIQPQGSGKLHGIPSNLLDYRGRPRSGMRVYLEMRTATMNMSAGKAARVSDVIWIGSEEQLFESVRKGLPPAVTDNAAVPEPALQPLASGRIPKGTPLWMRCGDRWARGNALEDAEGDRVGLLISLLRRDKPYLPWVAHLPRSELRIEQEALEELRRDAKAFHDLATANDAKLARQGVPNKLVPVDASNLKPGTGVLDWWNGMLDPCRTTGAVQGDNIPMQRVGLDNAKMVKPVKGLFLDPFAAPGKP